MGLLRADPHRFLVFCDDLSFDGDDTSYKSLKAALEGGIEGRPGNVLFYATSNRRHLLPRDMMENERSSAINPGRGGRGEGLAVRPLRPLARLPPLQPGRISGMVLGYAEHFGLDAPRGRDRARRAGMGDHARLPLGANRLAVHAGSRGAPGATARYIAALTGQFTSTIPAATSASAATKEGVRRSPSTSQPASTPTTGVDESEGGEFGRAINPSSQNQTDRLLRRPRPTDRRGSAIATAARHGSASSRRRRRRRSALPAPRPRSDRAAPWSHRRRAAGVALTTSGRRAPGGAGEQRQQIARKTRALAER